MGQIHGSNRTPNHQGVTCDDRLGEATPALALSSPQGVRRHDDAVLEAHGDHPHLDDSAGVGASDL